MFLDNLGGKKERERERKREGDGKASWHENDFEV